MRDQMLAAIKNRLSTLGYVLTDSEYASLLNDVMAIVDKQAEERQWKKKKWTPSE